MKIEIPKATFKIGDLVKIKHFECYGYIIKCNIENFEGQQCTCHNVLIIQGNLKNPFGYIVYKENDIINNIKEDNLINWDKAYTKEELNLLEPERVTKIIEQVNHCELIIDSNNITIK